VKDLSTKKKQFYYSSAAAAHLITLISSLLMSGDRGQGWAKLVLIALERYSVALKRLTFNLR
jgi:hypothetical protein